MSEADELRAPSHSARPQNRKTQRVIIAQPIARKRDAVLLAAAMLVASAAIPVQAQGNRVSVTQGKISRGAPYNLLMGRVLPLEPPQKFTYRVTEGSDIISAAAKDGILTVTPQKVGRATLVIEAPNYAPVAYSINVREAAVPSTALPEAPVAVIAATPAPVATPVTAPVITAPPSGTSILNTQLGGAPSVSGQMPVAPSDVNTAVAPDNVAVVAGLAGATDTVSVNTAPAQVAAPPFTPTPETPAVAAATPLRSVEAGPVTSPPVAPNSPLDVRPAANSGTIRNQAATPRTVSNVAGSEDGLPSVVDSAQILPSLPAPARSSSPAFPANDATARKLAAQNRVTAATLPRNAVTVTQGLARLFRFPNNILAVYFSDVNVMDARAVNARTVAITGIAPGASTLAVFTERYPGDAVGRSHVYHIGVRSPNGAAAPGSPRDPAPVETAIRAALNDPRIGVSVIQLPGGTLAARLIGTVRDTAEIEAARSIAGLYVPQVISALYTDKTAPTQESASALPSEQQLQAQLRDLTGNSSITFMTLPNGMAVKAEVGSIEEANALLNLIPDLGRPVTPFIVIRGASGTPGTYYDRPVLSGEDAEITRRMQTVTGVKTVYAVKVSSNAATPTDYGVAVYGTVRNRIEYDTVRRYAVLLTQTGGAVSGGAATGTIEQAEAANLISTGYRQPVGIHMFVRILDGSDAVVRRVTAETSVVEISRTALRNLGVQVGSVQLLSESVTGPSTTVTEVGGQPVLITNPGSVTREINPDFINGQLLGGNGFIGSGGFSAINPFRVQLNALFQKGNARILSQPNLSAVEGADAQITVGGTRPIPVTSTTGGGAGTVNNSVVFRNFGIILTMRPTLTDDDTIIMQIRADVTNIDQSTAINLGGAVIPGESVRSINTTITMREGDTIVMGGLITNERSEINSRIPILSNIPILGSLFRSKRFQNNETELAIFMTPRITRFPASVNTYTDIQRVPALPPLPTNQASSNISASFGGSTGGGG